MISTYGPGTEIATLFCIIGWAILTYKNFKNKLYIFSIASATTVAGYIVAFIQYYVIFYIAKTKQTDLAMNLLFIRMVLHCTTVIIFNVFYNAMPALKK